MSCRGLTLTHVGPLKSCHYFGQVRNGTDKACRSICCLLATFWNRHSTTRVLEPIHVSGNMYRTSGRKDGRQRKDGSLAARGFALPTPVWTRGDGASSRRCCLTSDRCCPAGASAVYFSRSRWGVGSGVTGITPRRGPLFPVRPVFPSNWTVHPLAS